MPMPLPADAVLDRYFPEMRAKVLDVAAALDRLDRAEGAARAKADPRLAKLQRAIGFLLDGQNDRATRVLMEFSDAYEPNWSRPAKRA